MQNALQPWSAMPGWQFDLLRALPPRIAKRLYSAAWQRASMEMWKTWKWWAFMLSGFVFATLSMTFIWTTAQILGVGPVGKIGLEIAFHATLGLLVFHPLARVQKRFVQTFLADALVDELMRFARNQELADEDGVEIDAMLVAIAAQRQLPATAKTWA